MWAPADLFTHPFSLFIRPLRHLVTYFHERPLMLVLVLALAAGVILIVETLSGRRRDG
ncbi:hypothetical protein [Lichenibacterium ramalinae]|uniref:hypothetical protein n=1 Tax=Lichenibacterium ramalinae TaxID=2316527 RepID=UPI0013EC7BBB|nr:hypothetical protein [Lichenibacterium ramalinae]